MNIYKSLAAGFLILTVLCVSVCADPNHYKNDSEKETIAVKLARETIKGGYDLITTEELKALIDAKKDMVIVDAMPYEASYKSAHIPGSKQCRFPVVDMDTWNVKETEGKTKEDFEKILGQDKDKLIVIYCAFVECSRSHNGAVWAKKLGYKNVKRYSGGIYAWKEAGYPVDQDK